MVPGKYPREVRCQPAHSLPHYSEPSRAPDYDSPGSEGPGPRGVRARLALLAGTPPHWEGLAGGSAAWTLRIKTQRAASEMWFLEKPGRSPGLGNALTLWVRDTEQLSGFTDGSQPGHTPGDDGQ